MAGMPNETASRTARLLTRADDIGNTRSSSRAAKEAFEEGVLRNASVMAPCPAVEHAADLLADTEGLCIGAHITMTSEWDRPRWGPVLPAEEVPSLVDDDGYFLPTPTALDERPADTEEMVAEARAQIDYLRELGFDLVYLDDHMHNRLACDFDERLPEVAEQEGLIDGRTSVKRLPEVRGGSPPSPWPPTQAEYLLERITAAEPGTYLAVGHPGYYEAETKPITGGRLDRGPGEWAAIMDRQRVMFTHDLVLQYCEEHSIELVRYSDL